MTFPLSQAADAAARLHEAAHRDGAEMATVSTEDLRQLLAVASHTQNNEAQVSILHIGTSGRGKQIFDHEARHQLSLVAQALGESIAAAGIIRDGVSLTGPELLHFAQDLKHHLAGVDQSQAAYNAVISYVLANPCESPMEFLHCWNEGNFDSLREEWPNAPADIYFADSLHPDFKGLGVGGADLPVQPIGTTLLIQCRDRIKELTTDAANIDSTTVVLLEAVTAYLDRLPVQVEAADVAHA